MKKLFFILTWLFISAGVAVHAAEKIEPPESCKQCGMSRETFAHGRMMAIFQDGTSIGTCSLNCAAVAMKENNGKKLKELKVADYATKRLIDARKAAWVIGGKEPGIMTELPKWAFKKKSDAVKFIQANEGRLTNFDEALKLAMKENE